MKFGLFREIRRSASTIEDIFEYLRNDLANSLRDVSVGLTRLTFADNIHSFSKEVVDLGSQQEVSIQNELRDGNTKIIPSGYVVIKKRSGRDAAGSLLTNNVAVNIITGDTEWTKDTLFLKNVGTQAATFTVLFMR